MNAQGGTDYTAADIQKGLDAGILDPSRFEVQNGNIVPNMLKQGNTNPFNVPYGPENLKSSDRGRWDSLTAGNGLPLADDGSNAFSISNLNENIFAPRMTEGPEGRGGRRGRIDPRNKYDAGPAGKTMFEVNNPSFNMGNEYAPGSTNAINQVVAQQQAQQLKVDNQAKQAQAAKAEKDRQATAAQARMNKRVTPTPRPKPRPKPKPKPKVSSGGSSSGRGGRGGRTTPKPVKTTGGRGGRGNVAKRRRTGGR